MIIITAKKDGFRRCGVAHSSSPVEYQNDAFTPEQLSLLQADPMLVVELTDAKGSKPASKQTDKKTAKE